LEFLASEGSRFGNDNPTRRQLCLSRASGTNQTANGTTKLTHHTKNRFHFKPQTRQSTSDQSSSIFRIRQVASGAPACGDGRIKIDSARSDHALDWHASESRVESNPSIMQTPLEKIHQILQALLPTRRASGPFGKKYNLHATVPSRNSYRQFTQINIRRASPPEKVYFRTLAMRVCRTAYCPADAFDRGMGSAVDTLQMAAN
jgi:hypothetical protein